MLEVMYGWKCENDGLTDFTRLVSNPAKSRFACRSRLNFPQEQRASVLCASIHLTSM
jgi:hypothetical protein